MLTEDQLVELLKLRHSGIDENDVVQAFHIPQEELQIYEQNLLTTIQRAAAEKNSFIQIAKRVNLSPITLNKVILSYQLTLPEDFQRPTRVGLRYLRWPRKDQGNHPARELRGVQKEEARSAAPEESSEALPRKTLRDRRIAQIQVLAAAGYTSATAIAQKMQLSPSTVTRYALQENIPLDEVKEKLAFRQNRQAIHEALQQHPTTLEELCSASVLTKEEIKKIVHRPWRSKSISLPLLIIQQLRSRNPTIDTLIEKGSDLMEMAEKTGLTHQRISQYLEETGQHGHWRECREKVLPLTKSQQQEFLFLLEQRIVKLAVQQGWAYQKTVEYLQKRHGTSIPAKTLLSLFEGYQYALEKGVKLSLQEFAQCTNLWLKTVHQIFLTVGVPAMYGELNIHPTPLEKKKAMERAYHRLKMNSPDVAYFLQLPWWVVNQKYQRLGGKRRTGLKYLKSFGQGRKGEGRPILTYRRASQIYEAQDAKFTTTEIQEYAGTTENVIDYAREHRPEIESKIIKALRVLYPREKVNTPYQKSRIR